ncbi:hypothetical protein J8J14_21115 [Roseomonas sp. SSH11]|uniref:Uncharacterized protein n=1 Tax=Pararoseomonas baculiformis TaxID=2820812 RepID=A0ABS4AJS5_9PROT|nr:hypothetical protein [Pararoseomonas baculiformis]MBP0447276.1 hypothetical protein [Pararoseomonas baculiformis]
MVERRFAALASLKSRPAAEPAPDEVQEPAVAGETAEAAPIPLPTSPPVLAVAPLAVGTAERGRGRPPGKRSDPDWKPRTILMRTKTHRRVSGLLLEQDDGPDLSELVDQLLTEWISKQR